MDWGEVIKISLIISIVIGSVIGIMFSKKKKILTSLIAAVIIFFISVPMGMGTTKIRIDRDIVEKIVLDTRENDGDMIYQIKEHLKRKNNNTRINYNYDFTNAIFNKELGGKSDKSNEITIDTYTISWDLEKDTKGKVGVFKLDIKVTIDSNKYTDVPIKVEIHSGY